jgi:hypothetical protein
MKKQITYLLISALLITSISGCGSSSYDYLKEYDSPDYKPSEIYNNAKDEVYYAAIDVLKERGYRINICDLNTGLITAEYDSMGLLPEEMAVLQKEQNRNTCAMILGVAVIVGIASLISNGNRGDEDNSSVDASVEISNRDDNDHVVSNKYSFSISVTDYKDVQTEATLSVTKLAIDEDGVVVKQNLLANKYLNNEIFKSIYKKLQKDNPVQQ